jgi:hypothetical protein
MALGLRTRPIEPTICDVVGGWSPAATGEVHCMKYTLASLTAALTLTLGAVTPASAYIDPGTGSMLLQMFAAGVAGAIFYFRELRIKVLSLFTRREAPAVEDSAESPPGDPPR